MSWFFNIAGYPNETISGGYKAYRRLVLAHLERPWPFIVVGGYTGSGKTRVLHALQELGAQVLDLEALCEHRGSAFGALNMPQQYKSEHAMNIVHRAITQLDPSRPIFVEDESQHIGSIWLHEPLFRHMRQSPLIIIRIPRSERARYLAAEYSQSPVDALAESFRKIAKPLGGDRLKGALVALAQGDLQKAADIALDHYDRSYAFGLQQREPVPTITFEADTVSPHELAQRILQLGHTAHIA